MEYEKKKFISFGAFTINTIGGEESSPPPVCNRVEWLIIEGPGWSQFLYLFREFNFA
jgi:hypothetical protein